MPNTALEKQTENINPAYHVPHNSRRLPLRKKRRSKAKHVSAICKQHHNGSHQDQIFYNLSALCLALWAKNWIQLLGALVHPIGTLLSE